MRANRPSRTALQVVQAIAFLAVDPQLAALLPPGLAESNEKLLLGSGLIKPRQLRRMESPRLRRFLTGFDRRVSGGQILFVGLRKRLLTDEANAAIANGCRQVLVVGGGLDTLAWRLAKAHGDILAVEVDHPASAARKRATLPTLGPLPPNLHLAPVDLAHDSLAAAVRAVPGWDPTAPAFVVAEGVLMYVERPGVERTFRELHESCGSGSSALFSYIRSDEHGTMQLGHWPRFAAWSLAVRGEPLRWAPRPGELAALLADNGWRLEREHFDLGERYLAPAGLGDRPLADIERYALASRA
jgi:methyltransferase (TIGR00027 family)